MCCEEGTIYRAPTKPALPRSWQHRAEFAGGEGFEGFETGGKFGGGEAVFAVEAAKKVVGVSATFGGVAFHAGGDEVAVGVAAATGPRDDVVEAAGTPIEAAKAIEAAAAVAIVDGSAMCRVLEEIDLFEVGRIIRRLKATGILNGACGLGVGHGQRRGVNLAGQAYFDDVAFSAALEHADDAIRGKAANGLTCRGSGKTGASGKPCDREMETALTLEMTVTEEMRVNGAIGGGKFEVRDQEVGELFPHQFCIGFLGFHFCLS